MFLIVYLYFIDINFFFCVYCFEENRVREREDDWIILEVSEYGIDVVFCF